MKKSKNNKHVLFKIYNKKPIFKDELLQFIYSTDLYKNYKSIMIQEGKIKISKYCKTCIYKTYSKKYCGHFRIDQTNNKTYCKYKKYIGI